MKLSTRLRLWWHRLYLRRDEFHISYSMDADAMLEMTQAERDFYDKDLALRREIAHYRDLALSGDKERNLAMARTVKKSLLRIRKEYRKTGKAPALGAIAGGMKYEPR